MGFQECIMIIKANDFTESNFGYFCGMILTDTHTHIYSESFEKDQDQMMQRAISAGVERFFVPAIDSGYTQSMYDIEKKYPDMEPLFRSVKYADEALRQFFETAKQMDWYENTLFIITADHIGVSHDGRFKTKVGKYQIPILLFRPDSKLKGKVDRLAQQIDVLPTIMDYLDFDEPYSAFGRSMFDDSQKQYAYMLSDGLYQILDGQHLLIFDGQETIARYDYKKDPSLKKKLKPSGIFNVLEKQLKAIIQQHDNRMIENTLYGSWY